LPGGEGRLDGDPSLPLLRISFRWPRLLDLAGNYVASKPRLADHVADGDGQACDKSLDANIKDTIMFNKNHLALSDRMPIHRRREAVVVGGSMAGMLAARVLSDHFDDVTLLERDRFPETPTARKGLPQGRHVHVLLGRGREVLEKLLPGLTDELVQAGAELMDVTRDVEWLGPYGRYVRFPGDLVMLASSRDLIDWGVRGRVAMLPNARIRQGVDVTGLIHGPGGGARVAGVRLRGRPPGLEADRRGAELAADLVVVADGRNSRLPDWLTALGYEPPQETVINSFQGYASRLYRPDASVKADWKALYIQQAPPDDPRGGLVSAVEGGLWLVSLVGGDGDYPPVDEAGFLDFARSLRSPALYEVIARAEPLSPITGQRATENRLRHYDCLGVFPEGVVAVGDAACAFNPVYGQGMTAAALGAEVLDRWLQGGSSHVSPGRGRIFQHELVRETAAAWQFSTGADYGFRTTEGPPQGRVARLIGRYIAGVMRASTRRPWVRRRLTEVLQLLRPPLALFGPGVLVRLAWDWFAGEVGAGYRRLVPGRKGAHGGLRPPKRSAPNLNVKTVAGGSG
jgi:2-polyprenyl-6-methoxyphenol hydroxylase-like FAD-dependent oxidoreductase